jgi:hypothetical protein
LVSIDRKGQPYCAAADALVHGTPDLSAALDEWSTNSALAVDCVTLWGGIPLPVAKAMLRSLELLHTALRAQVDAAAVDVESRVN